MDAELGRAIFYAAHRPSSGKEWGATLSWGAPEEWPEVGAEEVADLLTGRNVPEFSEAQLWAALGAAVDSARYWQEPGPDDDLAADPAVREELSPIAEAVAASPHVGWWAEGMDSASQHVVEPLDDRRVTEDFRDNPQQVLDSWRRDELELSRSEVPDDFSENRTGHWWSMPPNGLMRTTRSVPGWGAVGLLMVEDTPWWARSLVRTVDVPADPAVYEIDGPDAWAQLCQNYGMNVTASRRHDWYRLTGRDQGEWVIPDWTAVARDFDAVHLSVAGYLTVAGIPVDVTHGVCSVLAGWDPDATYWLTAMPTFLGEGAVWVLDDEGQAFVTE